MQGVGRRPPPPQQSPETRVAGQNPHVFDALSPGRLDQHDRLELVELRIPAWPHPHGQAGADDFVQTQCQQGFRHQSQAGPRRQVHRLRGGFEAERQDALAHATRRLRYYGPGSPRFTHWVQAVVMSAAGLTSVERF